jgi:hypothetical protein
MFTRANKLLGSNWTLHDLRHTATFLMLDDPEMPPVYVQHILGHKCLSTLNIYNNPSRDDVIKAGIAHHARQEVRKSQPRPTVPAPAYNPDSLTICSGDPHDDEYSSESIRNCRPGFIPGIGGRGTSAEVPATCL